MVIIGCRVRKYSLSKRERDLELGPFVAFDQNGSLKSSPLCLSSSLIGDLVCLFLLPPRESEAVEVPLLTDRFRLPVEPLEPAGQSGPVSLPGERPPELEPLLLSGCRPFT